MVSKVENVDPKVPKQDDAKRDGVINPQNYNFNQFYTEKFDALKRYESTEVDRRTWLHVELWCTIVPFGPLVWLII